MARKGGSGGRGGKGGGGGGGGGATPAAAGPQNRYSKYSPEERAVIEARTKDLIAGYEQSIRQYQRRLEWVRTPNTREAYRQGIRDATALLDDARQRLAELQAA